MKSFEKYAKKLDMDSELVFIRRVMWIDMEERIRRIFKEVEKSPYDASYGGMRIHNGLHRESMKLHVTQRINQLQITCMSRRLGLGGHEDVIEEREINGKTQEIRKVISKTYMEDGGALWFNQSPAGAVTVMMAPYKSELVSMKEKEIIIGSFKSPSKLTDRRIRKLFKNFFKYMSVTSSLHQHNIFDYYWRLWLIFLDIRTRKVWQIFVAINFLVIFAGAAVTTVGFFSTAKEKDSARTCVQTPHRQPPAQGDT